MRRILARAVLGVFLLCSPGLAACSKPQPRAPADLKKPGPDVRPSKFLEHLHLSKAQAKQVDRLAERLQNDFKDYDKTRLILLEEVLAQIRSGELNKARLEPLANDSVAAFEAHLPDLYRSLDALHKLLTPEQRKIFAGKSKSEEEEEKLTAKERQAQRQERIARILDLTASQKTRIYPAGLALALRHWGLINSMKSGLKDARDAFVQDEFHAANLQFFQTLDLMKVAEAIYDGLETMLPILTPAQRQTLAAYMDSRMR